MFTDRSWSLLGIQNYPLLWLETGGKSSMLWLADSCLRGLVRQVQQRASDGCAQRVSRLCPGLLVCPHCRAWLPQANPHGPRLQSQHRARTGQSSLRAVEGRLRVREFTMSIICGLGTFTHTPTAVVPTSWTPAPHDGQLSPWKEVKSVGDSTVTLTPARDRSQGPVRAAPSSVLAREFTGGRAGHPAVKGGHACRVRTA